MENIERTITQTLLEIPDTVFVGGEEINIYPMTLGKIHLLKLFVEKLEVRDTKNIALEALRLTCDKEDIVDSIIAIHINCNREDLIGKGFTKAVRRVHQIPREDKATLLIALLAKENNIEKIKKHLGIEDEHKYMKRAIEAKKDKGTYSFCGVSLYGAIINQAAEKYGWTMDYILWGISFDNLQLLLADAPQTVFLTDKERKQVHIPKDRKKVRADDPRNVELIKHKILTNSL